MINHIAFIMDGNSSWAKFNNVDLLEGYLFGMRNMVNVALLCQKFNLKHATFYVFSTENWKRPKKWVNSFMNLAISFYETDPSIKKLEEENIKLILLGDITKLNSKIQKILNDLIEKTKNNTGTNICLAISYGSRDEIVRSCKRIINNNLEITEDNIIKHLDANIASSNIIPDPDIIVRTNGKQRLSNFLLWQASYSELYFTDVFWPDFGEPDFQKVIDNFKKRNRTYGK